MARRGDTTLEKATPQWAREALPDAVRTWTVRGTLLGVAAVITSCATLAGSSAGLAKVYLDHRFQMENAALSRWLDDHCGNGFAEWVLLGEPEGEHEARRRWRCD